MPSDQMRPVRRSIWRSKFQKSSSFELLSRQLTNFRETLISNEGINFIHFINFINLSVPRAKSYAFIGTSFYVNWQKRIGAYRSPCPCVSEALRIAAEERDMETLKRLLPAAAQNGVAEDWEEGMTKRQCEKMRKPNLRALGQWEGP